MTREIKGFSSCFHVFVHIVAVLSESFLQALTCLSNTLIGAAADPTGDGIADVLCQKRLSDKLRPRKLSYFAFHAKSKDYL
jgi:hypothetical protein